MACFNIFDVFNIILQRACSMHLRHLQHASIYIEFDMVGKSYVSAFQNFFQIESLLNIKEVMSQNVCVCSFPIFDTFDVFNVFNALKYVSRYFHFPVR